MNSRLQKIALLCLASSLINVQPLTAAPTAGPSAPATQAAHSQHQTFQVDPSFHVDMKQVVDYLASDALEGRRVGTPGLRKAADFISSEYERLGLKTVPRLHGYFQPFDMTTRVDPDKQKTALDIDGKPLALGNDYMPLRSSPETAASGEFAYVGYGIVDPARKYDDFHGIDLTGRIAIIMRYEPHDKDGKSRFTHDDTWSDDASIQTKVANARQHGAKAVLLVNPPTSAPEQGLISFHRGYPRLDLPTAQITPAAADAILHEGGEPDLATLEAKIDDSLRPDSALLKHVSAKISFAIHRTEAAVENVVALLPGNGPLADEYVVIGAHYDHLGRGGPGSLMPWSHGIHHGADDNASGTAAVLEMADHFVHAGPQARSLLFVNFTGEEEGLVGSDYFVNHCPVPLEKIAFMLNLDMVGRVRNEKLLVGGEGTAAAFPKLVENADQGLALKLGEFGRGGFGPSDHMSFAKKKIPVLFLFSGMHMDYHTPRDTADKVNFHGMDEVVQIGQRIVVALANLPRQTYDDRYDAKGLAMMTGNQGSSGSTHGGTISIGAIPDYAQGEFATGGMRIGGIMPGSPAQRAGLKEGDLIVSFNGAKIDSMMDYMQWFGKAKPGQQIKLGILRGKQHMNVELIAAPATGG